MRNVMQFELEDGTPVYVEAKDAEIGIQRIGTRWEAERAGRLFLEALAHLRPATEIVLNTFREMNTPDEIVIEFGVKFSAKLGAAVFVSTEGDATFNVSLKWSNKRSAE